MYVCACIYVLTLFETFLLENNVNLLFLILKVLTTFLKFHSVFLLFIYLSGSKICFVKDSTRKIYQCVFYFRLSNSQVKASDKPVRANGNFIGLAVSNNSSY